MIVVIGGIKGGGGKTTIATNLAVLQSEFSKVLLVDADEQHSCSDWAEQRESFGVQSKFTTIRLSGKSIHTQLKKLAQDYDDIIVDVGGRDTTSQRSALVAADFCIIPFRPRSFDAWTIGQVKVMIAEVAALNTKLLVLTIINQADAKGSDNEEVIDLIKAERNEPWFIESSKDLYIVTRKAFSNAAASGLAVTELSRSDDKASKEIRRLHEHVYNTYKTRVKNG
jgi:chromosome partitioning protein